MKQNYFSLNFLRLLYNECDLYERMELENAILEDIHMKKECEFLSNSLQQLPRVLFSPKENTMMKVLEYSKT